VTDVGTENLLEVSGLRVQFAASGGKALRAVDGVSFHVKRGETLGIVGESGCGKSVACMSILKLVPGAKYAGGRALFDGHDTLQMNEKRLRALRGARVAMIFQEPMAALNPVHTIGQQICEAIRLHLPLSGAEARALATETLRQVRVPDAERVFNSYPFSLSGGLRQRAMIAMALVCKPDLLIADEPTTALDVTIQSQIMALIRRLREQTGMAVILISHDLGLISESADDILVMYAGRVCEYAPADELVNNPLHPYTLGLIQSRPSGIGVGAGMSADASAGGRLRTIPGNVPSIEERPAGCPFHPRCERASERCAAEVPPETAPVAGHTVSCWLYAEEM
jgi:peptide/nickel transport system ATP-binding protein/oligopeptide transport system ATP-binding protein